MFRKVIQNHKDTNLVLYNQKGYKYFVVEEVQYPGILYDNNNTNKHPFKRITDHKKAVEEFNNQIVKTFLLEQQYYRKYFIKNVDGDVLFTTVQFIDAERYLLKNSSLKNCIWMEKKWIKKKNNELIKNS